MLWWKWKPLRSKILGQLYIVFTRYLFIYLYYKAKYEDLITIIFTWMNKRTVPIEKKYIKRTDPSRYDEPLIRDKHDD